MKKFTEDYNASRIVRTHLFRCTWQLVCAEDYHWMLSLCGQRNRKVIESWMAQSGRAISDGNAYEEARDAIPPSAVPPREECLAELARRYFQSHSPATLEDFAWWTGLPLSDCRKAIHSIASELTEFRKHDLMLYIHQNCRTRGCREAHVQLPSYDEYLIGYKSRHLVLDESFAHHAHNSMGLFRPVILHRGQVVGNWHPKSHETSFFYPEEETDMADAYAKYEKYMCR